MVVLRNMITGLVALALALGTGWSSCVTLEQPFQAAAVAMEHLTSHQGHMHSSAHGHDAVGKTDMAAVKGAIKQEGRHDICLKCCGICVQTTVLKYDPFSISLPVGSRISFAYSSEQLRGSVVFVDPDIPKLSA